jgi:hypothetical protein
MHYQKFPEAAMVFEDGFKLVTAVGDVVERVGKLDGT